MGTPSPTTGVRPSARRPARLRRDPAGPTTHTHSALRPASPAPRPRDPHVRRPLAPPDPRSAAARNPPRTPRRRLGPAPRGLPDIPLRYPTRTVPPRPCVRPDVSISTTTPPDSPDRSRSPLVLVRSSPVALPLDCPLIATDNARLEAGPEEGNTKKGGRVDANHTKERSTQSGDACNVRKREILMKETVWGEERACSVMLRV